MIRSALVEKAPGAAAAVALGALCWRLGRACAAFDPLVTGLLSGMLVAALVPERLRRGRGGEAARGVFLPLGVVLYATNLRLDLLSIASLFAAVQLYAGTIAAYVAVLAAARRLGVREKSALLIFAGTAVCGASAIAVAAPAVKARREDFSLAVVSVAAWGLLGMLAYPLLRRALPMSETAYALLAGTTLHMTGFVAAAAAAGGAECLRLALAVKMARTSLLLAVVPLLSWRSAGLPAEDAEAGGPAAAVAMMGAFLAVALLSSFAPAFAPAREALKPAAAFCLTVALVSVGLGTDAAAVAGSARGGLGAALAGWAAVIAAFAAGMAYFGY